MCKFSNIPIGTRGKHVVHYFKCAGCDIITELNSLYTTVYGGHVFMHGVQKHYLEVHPPILCPYCDRLGYAIYYDCEDHVSEGQGSLNVKVEGYDHS